MSQTPPGFRQRRAFERRVPEQREYPQLGAFMPWGTAATTLAVGSASRASTCHGIIYYYAFQDVPPLYGLKLQCDG